MATKTVKFVPEKCSNTLCYDRLPSGACDMGEKSDKCLVSLAFQKLSEKIADDNPINELWIKIKENKIKKAVEES